MTNMGTWKLKSCPRCRGDMFIDRDTYGWYEECMQCGFHNELESMVEFSEKLGQTRKAPTLSEKK